MVDELRKAAETASATRGSTNKEILVEQSTNAYEPGTVAVATVGGVPNVRVMWRDAGDGWLAGWFAESGHAYAPASKVTDVRPLVVLDLNEAAPKGWKGSDFANWLRVSAGKDEAAGGQMNLRPEFLRNLADQIEAQTKPPRIPEPGLWGVVEAGHKHLGTGRARFVRIPPTPGRPEPRWFDSSWESDFAAWDDLIDPTLIREGVES